MEFSCRITTNDNLTDEGNRMFQEGSGTVRQMNSFTVYLNISLHPIHGATQQGTFRIVTDI